MPWSRHLPLVVWVGNWGSRGGDTPADARYTLLGLSAFGVLALAVERGEVGPIPLGLVDGTVTGDLDGLAAGRPARLVLGSVLAPEQAVPYIPGMPRHHRGALRRGH